MAGAPLPLEAETVAIPGMAGDLAGCLVRPGAAASPSPSPSSRASMVSSRPAVVPSRPAVVSSRPAVLVLPEIDGFCEGTVAAARRLAAAGYVALALDLYAPYGGTPPLRSGEDTAAWLSRLDDRRQLSDLACAVAWLAAQPGVDPTRLAAVGFSIGGRYATLLATEPHGLRAVVSFYSRPWPGGAIAEVALASGDHVARLGTPVCAIFGLDDELVPSEMVDRFADLLDQHPEMGHEVHRFPGRHFFANESRPRRYQPDAAEQAWAVALRFLRRSVGEARATT